MDDPYKDCTLKCERMPECATCHRTKNPRGRSAPMETTGSYCDSDCSGYYSDPKPGHLWPGELAGSRANGDDDD
jgi:hypothetical protein